MYIYEVKLSGQRVDQERGSHIEKEKTEKHFLDEAIRYARQLILQTPQLKMLMRRRVTANRSNGLPASAPLPTLQEPLGRGGGVRDPL